MLESKSTARYSLFERNARIVLIARAEFESTDETWSSSCVRPPRQPGITTRCTVGALHYWTLLPAMIPRTVRRHRPHSIPAPHAWAISLVLTAPFATRSSITSLVTPVHRQTNIWQLPRSSSTPPSGDVSTKSDRSGSEGYPILGKPVYISGTGALSS